ncbi:hypothetical protein APHAL10511_004554 [Amanita phalloides]|nr:hypothetical protein APHAL10511_004554 [Amanita phalloides]
MDPANAPPQSNDPAAPPPPKRRRRAADAADEPAPASGTRRLRRSHEACARCRNKKIKCDSKHPRCTACATAGTLCQQEDRHKQTLTPRGHTERIEFLLAQCTALLKHHVPGFNVDNIDDYLLRDGIDASAIAPPQPPTAFQSDQQKPHIQHPKSYPLYSHPPPHLVHPPYPPGLMPYGPPPGPYHPLQGPYPPHLLPAFQHPYPSTPVHGAAQPVQRSHTKGQDPNGNDLSTTDSLAKNFGVHAAIVSEIPPALHDREDLAVGSNGLSSGRDRLNGSAPRESKYWTSVSIRSPYTPTEPAIVWLPKDRDTAQRIIDAYFQRLNCHRPVFAPSTFQKILNDLYDGITPSYDPGHVCSVYLVFALGTLSELNLQTLTEDHSHKDSAQVTSAAAAEKWLFPNWPDHGEFFRRALVIKPHLRVTISSLQALILLHWYLYIERPGRTLWRLVGSLVRLATELGLHHDPTTQVNPSNQQPLFTEEEQLMRIRLWSIVIVHDRGTSILLGRPLAIAPSDSNTPAPKVRKDADGNVIDMKFSPHFEHSSPIAEIQADIIVSLYSPNRQDKNTIMRNAIRIIKKFSDFKKGMPEKFQFYFGGTEDWTLEQKSKLVKEITEDEGLTLLKIGIARILFLRALFSSEELPYGQRRQALVDAIITSHNTIVVHNQLIRYPEIGFFTSPSPLHIAAMVILYGQTSKCDCLPKNAALEDIWLALDMLPRFRWRWERKDANGSHPLIAKVAERVLEVNLQTVHPEPVANPILLPEPKWEEYVASPPVLSQHPTPIISASSTQYGAHSSATTNMASYGPHPRPVDGPGVVKGDTTPPEKSMGHFPTPLFFPFFPEAVMPANHGTGSSNSSPGYQEYLAVAATTQDSSYGNHSVPESYIDDTTHPRIQHHPQNMNMWVGVNEYRPS